MPAVTSKKDPTNQGKTRQRAKVDFNRRLASAKRQIMDVFNGVPRQHSRQKIISNQSVTIWEYIFTEFLSEEISKLVAGIIIDAFEVATETPPANWWFAQYDERAYRAGTMQENQSISGLEALLVGVVIFETIDILSTRRYTESLREEIGASYRTIKEFADRTAAQINQVIINGLRDGRSPKEITKEITRRFNVAKSAAARIVDTEVNRANNHARTGLAAWYRETQGANLAVVHISALLATTRVHHADRHSKVYTPEQQDRWWSEGANRINCHCSVRTVALDDDGNIIEDRFLKRLREQRSFFKN